VPAVLVFVNCCLTGYTEAFPNAFLQRGTQYVIAHRREASGGWCSRLAYAFYERWLEENLDPSKVPDIFYDVSPPTYPQTWATLFPSSARPSGGGIDDGVLAGILIGAGVLLAGAAVLIWGAATDFNF
jgi:hypothetical protein